VPHIHSKPVGYTNNGGGRDSYISSNCGGLKTMHQPAYNKRTFYSNLRQYPQIENYGKRVTKNPFTSSEKADIFSRSQNHWSAGFNRELSLVNNYQRGLDQRLSKPKNTKNLNRVYVGGNS